MIVTVVAAVVVVVVVMVMVEVVEVIIVKILVLPLKDLLRQGVHLHGQEGVCIHRWGDRAHQGGGTYSGKSSQIAQKFTFSLFG